MSQKIATLLAAAVFAGSVSLIVACPDDEKHGKAGTTVAHDGKAPCGAKAGAPCAKSGGAPCHAKGTTVVSGESHGDNRIDAVLARLPKITYRVGDEATCCEKTAAMIAEKSGKPIQYVLGEEVLDSHCAAEVKLASLLEQELESIAAMRFAVGDETVGCPVTAKELAKKNGGTMAYRVGGVDFNSEEQAGKAVQLVTDAVDGVKMSYRVDGQSFCCDKMAGMKAKETGKPMTFVVGSEETDCDKHARLILMQTKIRAAVEAALSASST